MPAATVTTDNIPLPPSFGAEIDIYASKFPVFSDFHAPSVTS